MYITISNSNTNFKLPFRPQQDRCAQLFKQDDCILIYARKITCPEPKKQEVIVTSTCYCCCPKPKPPEPPKIQCCDIPLYASKITYTLNSYNINKYGYAIINKPDNMQYGTYFLEILINSKHWCCEPIYLKITECLY